jgi:hypothetical protein
MTWDPDEGSETKGQSFSGLIGFGIAAMFATEYQTEEKGRVRSPASAQHVMRYWRSGTSLIHSCRPIQQLLLRVIFLPGLSVSSKPICHLTFP